jgi:hypothetical protein
MPRTAVTSPLSIRAAVAAIIVCLGTGAFAQAVRKPQSGTWTIPRTPSGAPDFQGVTWNFATMTPLVRPAGIDKPVLTEAEAAVFEKQVSERQTATTNNGYDWWDGGAAHLDHRRTSLIIDPESGQIPALTADAQRRAAGRPRNAGTTDGPEAFPLNTRCIQFVNGATPILPSPYNNNLQFVQTRDFIVLSTENIHDGRIVPMDGRPHGTVARWMGDSRGHWDGDTLVIDTINFSSHTNLRGSDGNLHIVERFRFIDANTLEYQFTADDATVWVRPWTAMLTFSRTNDVMYEFACHEGNFLSIENMLRIARRAEQP